MVRGNAWDVTVDCSGLYWSGIVLWSEVMPGLLLWTVVVSTVRYSSMVRGNAWDVTVDCSIYWCTNGLLVGAINIL